MRYLSVFAQDEWQVIDSKENCKVISRHATRVAARDAAHNLNETIVVSFPVGGING